MNASSRQASYLRFLIRIESLRLLSHLCKIVAGRELAEFQVPSKNLVLPTETASTPFGYRDHNPKRCLTGLKPPRAEAAMSNHIFRFPGTFWLLGISELLIRVLSANRAGLCNFEACSTLLFEDGQSLHPTPNSLHPASYTLHPTPYTL